MRREIQDHSAEGTTGGSDLDARPRVPVPESASILSWRMVAWGIVVGGMALAVSELSDLWWFVLIFGLLVPLVSALQTRWSTDRRAIPHAAPQDKEGELLRALGELGELTATTAAMRTTLTVEEASGMLEKLAKRGHLQATTQGAVMLYALWEPDRLGSSGALNPRTTGDEAPAPAGSKDTLAAEPLIEPLTEREREVFELLASGRTNREIAADLFVSVGTIKAHTSNIYAKLQARNRAEALARARELGLLG